MNDHIASNRGLDKGKTSVSELDAHYMELLRRGLPALQLAVYSGNDAWMKVEIEFLHNIPSLIGEANLHRHSYFWNSERLAYLDWLNQAGEDHQESFLARYQPVLNQIEQVLNDLLHDVNQSPGN